jgi:hypothetical protein
MDALVISALVFGCICLGIFVGAILPGYRLDSDTRDVIRLGAGLIATMVSLVLGLLVSSAKDSYDSRSGQVRQLTANIVLLDELLSEYGSDARPARVALRQLITPLVKRIWQENLGASPTFRATAGGQDVYSIIQSLVPKNEAQRDLKPRSVQLLSDISQTRLLLFEQSTNAIPKPFLVVLVSWLVILFTSYSLFAKPNATIIVALLAFGLSATAAIFLILELSDPFTGLIKISEVPLRQALSSL